MRSPDRCAESLVRAKFDERFWHGAACFEGTLQAVGFERALADWKRSARSNPLSDGMIHVLRAASRAEQRGLIRKAVRTKRLLRRVGRLQAGHLQEFLGIPRALYVNRRRRILNFAQVAGGKFQRRSTQILV